MVGCASASERTVSTLLRNGLVGGASTSSGRAPQEIDDLAIRRVRCAVRADRDTDEASAPNVGGGVGVDVDVRQHGSGRDVHLRAAATGVHVITSHFSDTPLGCRLAAGFGHQGGRPAVLFYWMVVLTGSTPIISLFLPFTMRLGTSIAEAT